MSEEFYRQVYVRLGLSFSTLMPRLPSLTLSHSILSYSISFLFPHVTSIYKEDTGIILHSFPQNHANSVFLKNT